MHGTALSTQFQFPRKHIYPYYIHQTGNNACESTQYSTSTLSRRHTKYYYNRLNEQNELTKYWVAYDHSWFVILLLVWPSCALPDSQTLWVWACGLTAVAGQQGHWVVGSAPVLTPAKHKQKIQESPVRFWWCCITLGIIHFIAHFLTLKNKST
jgi:hypothetical protein